MSVSECDQGFDAVQFHPNGKNLFALCRNSTNDMLIFLSNPDTHNQQTINALTHYKMVLPKTSNVIKILPNLVESKLILVRSSNLQLIDYSYNHPIASNVEMSHLTNLDALIISENIYFLTKSGTNLNLVKID